MRRKEGEWKGVDLGMSGGGRGGVERACGRALRGRQEDCT